MESQEYILCAANHYIFNKNGKMPWWKRLFPIIKSNDWIRTRGISPHNISEGIVLCGWRHACIIAQMNALTGLKQYQTTEVQGFLTNKNKFVNRREAYNIAKAAGQLKEWTYSPSGQLFSEDLY